MIFGDAPQPSVSLEIGKVDSPRLGGVSHLVIHTRGGQQGVTDIVMTAAGIRWHTPNGQLLDLDHMNLRGTFSVDSTLRVDHIELRRHEVRYWGSGEIDLDLRHRLHGKLSTETNDLDGLLDIVSPHLVLTESQKSNLRMVVGLLSQNAKLDLIAQDGEFYIGPVKVGDLQPLY